MRNGITPVVPLRAAGVNVAMGLDDKTINDDEDAVMELRMMHKVHRLHTFDLVTPALSAYEALEIATLNGGKATGFADEVGALVPGMKGDAILVDLKQFSLHPIMVRTMGLELRGGSARQLALNHRRRHSRPWEARYAIRFAASTGTVCEHFRPMLLWPSGSAADSRFRSRSHWRPACP
jgi:cytosine/adenosine deaminase-related metal-dependent hydrolase